LSSHDGRRRRRKVSLLMLLLLLEIERMPISLEMSWQLRTAAAEQEWGVSERETATAQHRHVLGSRQGKRQEERTHLLCSCETGVAPIIP